MKTIIDITAILNADLKSRSAVNDLALYINNTREKQVVVDFANVQFVTRSFIDEFYNVFLKNRNKDITIEIINLSPDIQSVLDAVSRTQTKKKSIHTGSVLQFSTIDEVKKYLSLLAF